MFRGLEVANGAHVRARGPHVRASPRLLGRIAFGLRGQF
jgi:hypothetical protein